MPLFANQTHLLVAEHMCDNVFMGQCQGLLLILQVGLNSSICLAKFSEISIILKLI